MTGFLRRLVAAWRTVRAGTPTRSSRGGRPVSSPTRAGGRRCDYGCGQYRSYPADWCPQTVDCPWCRFCCTTNHTVTDRREEDS